MTNVSKQDRSSLVRRAAELHASGLPRRTIARRLRNEGYKSIRGKTLKVHSLNHLLKTMKIEQVPTNTGNTTEFQEEDKLHMTGLILRSRLDVTAKAVLIKDVWSCPL